MEEKKSVKLRGLVFEITQDPEDYTAPWLTNATVFEGQDRIVVTQFGGLSRTAEREVFLTQEEIANLAKVSATDHFGRNPEEATEEDFQGAMKQGFMSAPDADLREADYIFGKKPGEA